MFFHQLMLIVGSVFVVTAGLASAKVAPESMQTNMLDNLPQLQLEDAIERAMCPVDLAANPHLQDLTRLDVTHLYDWVHPTETRAAREKCAMPALDPDVFENIG
jgi:hypothetical protein